MGQLEKKGLQLLSFCSTLSDNEKLTVKLIPSHLYLAQTGVFFQGMNCCISMPVNVTQIELSLLQC